MSGSIAGGGAGKGGTAVAVAAQQGGTAVATGGVAAPAPHDPTANALLEYASPTAALIGQTVPARSRYTLWVLVSIFAVGLGLIGVVPIDRVVTSSGKLVTVASNVVVQPLETSIVRSIDVREGQLVHAGDLLARLDPTFAQADVGSMQQQASSLQAEVDRLQAEVDGRSYLSDGTPASDLQAMMFAQRHAERTYKLENYRQKIDGLKVRVQQALGDVQAYSARLDVAAQTERMRRDLERLQVGSKINTLAAVDNRVEMARFLDDAKAQAAGAQRDLGAMIAERDGFLQQDHADTSQQLTDQQRKLSDARQSLDKALLRRKLVELRADRDSIVLSVAPISVGSVMQSGDQFITLVPVDAPLEVEAMVDGRDAGFVRVGDFTTLKFDTFPYTIYGTADGTVTMVSPDSFRKPTQDRQQVTRPRNDEDFGNVYFRTRISLDRIKLHDLPAGFRLSPGMPVTSDIKIGKRTVLQYLFARVIPATTEGMREP